ncbi:MAG: tyrosine-type recombinase/integrase [Candidatus Thiodiazotropha taylori]
MANITEKFVRDLQPTDKRQIITDDKLKQFGVRVNPSGHMTYIVRYRIGKAQKIYTIGPVAAFTAAQARARAKSAIADITRSVDPQAVKVQQREMPLLKEWVEEYLKTSSNITVNDDRVRSKPFISALGGKPLNTINTQEIRRILNNLTSNGKAPATVNRHRSLIHKIFVNAIDAGIVKDNPVAKIKPLKENNERVRYLSPDETQLFIKSLAVAPQNAANAIKVLLLTGQRKADVLSMKWDHIDRLSGYWTIPKAKNQKTHNVPLTDELIMVLDDQLKQKVAMNPYVFPGRHGKGHITDIYHIFKDVCANAGISDLRPHDLRHNYASKLAMHGVSLFTVGQLLGHADAKTTKRYAHLSDESLKETARATVINLSEIRKKQNNE